MRIDTTVVGFTEEEWADIRASARLVELGDAGAGIIVFRDRPEVYLLVRKGPWHFDLKLSSMEETAELLAKEARYAGEQPGLTDGLASGNGDLD